MIYNIIAFLIIIFILAASDTKDIRIWVSSCLLSLILTVTTEDGIFFLILIGLLYLAYKKVRPYKITYNNCDGNKKERLNALKEAKIYLTPYKDIWSDLKLINKYCKLTLGKDGVTIEGFEKNYPQRHFKIISNGVHTTEELWNLFCKYFSWNKSYNGLIEDCKKYGVTIIESIGNQKSVTKNNTVIPIQERTLANELKEENSSSKNEPQKEKLDINNCSEAELTELPGISIVLSKKIIKKREEIGGFKTVEDFFIFLKLKPHIEKQLRTLIKIEKMKGSIIKPLNKERTIDL